MYMMIKQTGHSTEANDCVQQKNSNSTEHIKSKYMHLVKTKCQTYSISSSLST